MNPWRQLVRDLGAFEGREHARARLIAGLLAEIYGQDVDAAGEWWVTPQAIYDGEAPQTLWLSGRARQLLDGLIAALARVPLLTP